MAILNEHIMVLYWSLLGRAWCVGVGVCVCVCVCVCVWVCVMYASCPFM